MESLDKIMEYMSEGDFRKAIKELNLIIEHEPIGLFGSFNPTLPRLIAFATASTASF